MKREIRRDIKLAPFAFGLAELELLWTRLEALFEDDSEKSFYVDIEFDDEKLTFESLEELRSGKYPRSKSNNFTLHCHGAKRSVHLYTPPHAGTEPRLVVSSDSEIWAAGAREVVLTVINQNRAWHHWLRPKLMASLLMLGMLTSVAALALVQTRQIAVDRATVFGVAGTVLVLALLVVGRARVLPLATLRLAEEEGFWRRYSVELTLALAFISALLTAYGLLVPKIGP
jgi:hypothetical protein